jgi:hypothetical protein
MLARAFDPAIPEMSEWRARAVGMPRRDELLASARRLPAIREHYLVRVEAKRAPGSRVKFPLRLRRERFGRVRMVCASRPRRNRGAREDG